MGAKRDERPEGADDKEREPKKKDGVSSIKLIASGVAAITASMITSKLTSYMGSIIIVGLSSVLIAILAEVYTRILKKSKKLAAKATYHIPYGKVLPESMSRHIDDRLLHAMHDTDTYDLQGLPEKLDEMESEDDSANPTENADAVKTTEAIAIVPEGTDADAATASAESADDADASGDADADGPDDESAGGVRGFLKGMLSATSTKIMALFLAFAVITTGVSWSVATFVEKPDVTNVTVKKVEELSPAEKDAIKKAAADEVSSQIANAQRSADSANSSTSSLSGSVSAMETKIKAMQTTIDNLQSEYDRLSKSADQTQPSTQDESDIANLKSEIRDLQSQVKTLQSQQQTQPSTPSSPTPEQQTQR